MRIRFSTANCASAFVLAAVWLASADAQVPASKPAAALPRTPDGRPDLEGIWTNNTLTPLERPTELRDTPALTEQAAAAYEKQVVTGRNRDQRDSDPEVDVGRAYNELFFDQGARLARIGGTIRSSIIVDPPDGRIPPLTPEAQKRLATAREHARLHPADRAQDRSLAERCVFWATAGPPMLPGPYNNTYQIYQTKDYVAILSEMIHETRIIPLDRSEAGRPHLPPGVRKWTGDSRGHWEGDTLVIDTTNFTDKTNFRGADENLHVIERITRVSRDAMVYKFTIDDPTAFTKPWTGELPLTAALGPIYEYACHEGNYAMVDILSGARAEEKAEAARKSSK
jgi:hypothetical protein